MEKQGCWLPQTHSEVQGECGEIVGSRWFSVAGKLLPVTSLTSWSSCLFTDSLTKVTRVVWVGLVAMTSE